jgi:hypothetical protein
MEPWNLTEAQRRQFREAHAEAKRAQMADPDFPADLPAADTDDPAKGWRVMDSSGNTADYELRHVAREAMYEMRGSSAVYDRNGAGGWRLYETLVREG